MHLIKRIAKTITKEETTKNIYLPLEMYFASRLDEMLLTQV